MSDKKQQTLVANLTQRVRFLQGQLDESVQIESALVATLTELVPGFGPRFAQLHKAAKSVVDRLDAQVAATVAKELQSLKTRKPQ
jgi:hypothetical protein